MDVPEAQYTRVGEAAIKIGILSVLAAIILGIGSLGYYCFGLTPPDSSALEMINTERWTPAVKFNIQSTYTYLFVSIYIWIIACGFVFYDPGLFWAFSSLAMVVVDLIIQILVQSGKSFSYFSSEGFFSPQRVVWAVYCAFLGGMTSPAFLYGGETVKLAFHVTYITVILLVILSLIAPIGKYAAWHPDLNSFEAIVFVGSIGSAFFPLSTSAGAIFFSISFYGGLVLFMMYFLCHSQEAQIAANETTQRDLYSPLINSVPMFLDVISIFTRIVVMVPPK